MISKNKYEKGNIYTTKNEKNNIYNNQNINEKNDKRKKKSNNKNENQKKNGKDNIMLSVEIDWEEKGRNIYKKSTVLRIKWHGDSAQ